MSAATADAGAAPKGGGKKKLLMLVVIALLVLGVGGGAAVFLLKKKKAAEDEDADAPAATETHAKHDPKHPPVFVPLDAFTVNLADRETERYAQIGITLEVDDAKVGDEIKAYMPAIRNNILMVLAHKTSQELLAREGKERLAFEIKRESSRALGIEIDDEEPPEAPKAEKTADKQADKQADAEDEPKPARKKKKKKAVETPIKNVQFSNFIIQ
jgi:flagellar FliL protein